ncbi:alginate O-acetyltransferase AlgX-related protein [Pseudorhodobacter sp.]|uniref:alginate O-acetyltransferase AlgX-related protein n=1 Tax=Pseudorhodobacter sp. TaxID=1934400 RepID=UPI002AFEB6A7|nr:hypothetical protein [Pseudorhodobacter sp.]
MHRARFILFLLVGLSVFSSLPLIKLLPRILSGDSLAAALSAEPIRSLWSVDGLEGRLAYHLIDCCEISVKPNVVVAGKQGFLFLGNDSDRVIDKTIGIFRQPRQTIDAWTQSVARLRDFAKSNGAEFAMIIAPNKHSIYPEFLPTRYVPAKTNVTDDFLTSAAETGLSVLDLRPILRTHKADGPLYYRTDTHWTHIGAAIAHENTMAHLERQTGWVLERPTYIQHAIKVGSGDLARLLKITSSFDAEHEADSNYDFGASSICQGQINTATDEQTSCEPTHFGDIWVNSSALIVTRVPDAPNPQSVLALCDSFCTATSSLLNASFQTVYRIPWANLSETELRDEIKRLSPDIVMLQVVERLLLSPQIGLAYRFKS